MLSMAAELAGISCCCDDTRRRRIASRKIARSMQHSQYRSPLSPATITGRLIIFSSQLGEAIGLSCMPGTSELSPSPATAYHGWSPTSLMHAFAYCNYLLRVAFRIKSSRDDCRKATHLAFALSMGWYFSRLPLFVALPYFGSAGRSAISSIILPTSHIAHDI